MRILIVLAAVLALHAATETTAGKLWTELKTKRENLTSLHQEFEVTRTSKTTHGAQSAKWQLVLDMSQGKWREKSSSGSGTRLTIFDGTDEFSMEEGGDEFVRMKTKARDGDPLPAPYFPNGADWSKASEVERRPCGLTGKEHVCALLEVRLKPWSRNTGAKNVTKMLEGSARVLVDTETGVVIRLHTLEVIQSTRTAYQSDVNYVLKKLSYGTPADAALFKLPSEDLREVKELSRWNSAKIRKQLKGKPAPELTATDMQGKPVTLSAFKGKTVLLDFWTTWCPPCRADAPALDKLYRKYGEGGQEFTIVGISVSEDRAVVEEFLKSHPHSFPIVLTSENELPGPYQIGAFPTYIVIDKDGTVASAVEGDQGFADLRKLLKKAGLDVD